MPRYILHIGHLTDPRLTANSKLHHHNEPLIKTGDDDVHILMAPNLKARKVYYENLKRYTNKPIVAIFYPQTWSDFLKTATENPLEQFRRLQPPVQTIDCDAMMLAPNSVSLHDAVLNDLYVNPELDQHDNPYHKETITKHICLVGIELVRSKTKWYENQPSDLQFSRDKTLLYTTSIYHDLGKFWTKTFNETKGYSQFLGHENVSACIFVTEALLHPEKFIDNESFFDHNPKEFHPFNTYFELFTKEVTQVILNHMFVKTDGYTPKNIQKRNLSEHEQWALEIFNQADNKGRKL